MMADYSRLNEVSQDNSTVPTEDSASKHMSQEAIETWKALPGQKSDCWSVKSTDTDAALEIIPLPENVMSTRSLKAEHLAREILDNLLSGGSAVVFKPDIHGLRDDERLQLALSLNSIVKEHNQSNGLVPGRDAEALIVDVAVDKDEHEKVKDIDIMRNYSSSEQPERVMERIDLYDPNLSIDITGKVVNIDSIDRQQETDAITAPYEMLFKAALESKLSQGEDYSKELAERLFKDAAGGMRRDLEMRRDLGESDPDSSIGHHMEKLLKDNLGLLEYFEEPQYRNSIPLFPSSSLSARNELRPNPRVQELIDQYRSLSSRTAPSPIYPDVSALNQELLAKKIVRELAAGGTPEQFREPVAALSDAQRLTLALDLHKKVEEHNQSHGLVPGSDNEALILDAYADKDCKVTDIDLMRPYSSSDQVTQPFWRTRPDRVMERVDLYTPDGTKDIDRHQEIDAIAATYAPLSDAKLEWALKKWEGSNDQEKRQIQDLVHEHTVKEISSDLNLIPRDRFVHDVGRSLRAYPSPWYDNDYMFPSSQPLFRESALLARQEMRPFPAVLERIDWYQKNSLDAAEENR